MASNCPCLQIACIEHFLFCAFCLGEVILDGPGRLGVKCAHVGAAGAPRAAPGGGVALQLPVLHARLSALSAIRALRASCTAGAPSSAQTGCISTDKCRQRASSLYSNLCLQLPLFLNHAITFLTPTGRLQCREQARALPDAQCAPGTVSCDCP